MKNVMFILVVCMVASIVQGAVLFTEDWQTGTVDAGKWTQIGGGAGGFVYDTLGDGDYGYYMRDSGAYQTALVSLASFDRADDLICSFKLFRDTGAFIYTGPGGPWWKTNTPGGTYPGLENFEAAIGRANADGTDCTYVEGTSSLNGASMPAQFVTDFSNATSKANALTIHVRLGLTTGAKVEWSTDGISFTTAYDTIGDVAGTNYAGDNLVSDIDPVFLGFVGSGTDDGTTQSRPIIDDIIVASGVLNEPPSVDAGYSADWPSAGNFIHLPDIMVLDATTSDDGNPDPPGELTLTWSQISGPAGGTATFTDTSIEDPNVTFNIDGVYVLQLDANDLELGVSDMITLYVRDADLILGVTDIDVSDDSLGLDGAGLLTRTFDTHRMGVEDAQPTGWGWVASTTDPSSDYVVLDLGGEFDLYRVEVWNLNSTSADPCAGVRNMEILASNDETFATSESLQVVTDLPKGPVDQSTAYGEKYTVAPTGGPYRYIKLDIASNWGAAAEVGLAQVEFYGTTTDDCAAIKAHYGYVQMEKDWDNNCYIDLGDFAIFAAEWLDANPGLP